MAEETGSDDRWRAESLRHAAIRGRRLHYLDVGSGPAVVLVHGLGGSWQSWLENISALSRTHRVIAIDLPGFGESEPTTPGAGTDEYVSTLVDLLDFLRVRSVVLIGHSLGGLVITRLAEQRPERARGLVLISAGSFALGGLRLAVIGFGFGVFDAVVRRTPLIDLALEHDWLRWALLRAAVRRPAALNPALTREVVPALRAPGFATAVTAALEGVRRAHPASVRCPTMIVWGRHDRLVPVANAHDLHEAIPGSRLVILDDVGHCAMFERPTMVNRLLLRFLAQLDTEQSQPAAPDDGSAIDRSVEWYPGRSRRDRLAAIYRPVGRRPP